PEVRHALYDMVNWWLDKGIDGFRVDAISHIKKYPGMPDLPNPDNLDFVPSFDMHMNQEGIHEFLKELKEETFDKYDIMTVGEANGVKIHQADEWVGEQNGKFDMVFQFEHLGLWGKGADNSVDVIGLKQTLSKWQTELHGNGWNALFFENHDQPRSVSTWGNDEEFWMESAKMLGACYFLMQGTPFIYQGQEIGMTNVQFDSIEDYDDVGMKNYYRIETAKGRSHQEMMEIIWKSGRDNSRTPMQWNHQQNAGFTDGNPWMKVNVNHQHINVETQMKDPQSIYSFYKDMISLRKEHQVFVYGDYTLLLEDHPAVYAYKRSYEDSSAIVICNFGDQPQSITVADLPAGNGKLMLSNYDSADRVLAETVSLKPYETRVYLF
ncbi:MAG: alpha-amylase family glycosyl hydrolase, partial [Paenisporosarcina sp.]